MSLEKFLHLRITLTRLVTAHDRQTDGNFFVKQPSEREDGVRLIEIDAIVVFAIVGCELDEKIIFRFDRLTDRIEASVASDAYFALHFQMELERIFVSDDRHFGIHITSQDNVLIERLEESIIELIFKVMTARCKRT